MNMHVKAAAAMQRIGFAVAFLDEEALPAGVAWFGADETTAHIEADVLGAGTGRDCAVYEVRLRNFDEFTAASHRCNHEPVSLQRRGSPPMDS